MEVFYYDKIIEAFEQNHKFNNLLNYLENLFKAEKTVNYLVTILAYSWFFLTSNEFDNEVGYDWKCYLDNWKRYIEIGKKDYPDDAVFNFVAGYTLGLHHTFIDTDKYNYERDAEIFMEKAAKQSEFSLIKILAENFIANEYKRKFLNRISICKELFPTNSYLDIYFREIYVNQ